MPDISSMHESLIRQQARDRLPPHLRAMAEAQDTIFAVIGGSQSGSATESRQTSRVSSGQSGRGALEDGAPSVRLVVIEGGKR